MHDDHTFETQTTAKLDFIYLLHSEFFSKIRAFGHSKETLLLFRKSP